MSNDDYRGRRPGWVPAWPGRGRARVARGHARVTGIWRGVRRAGTLAGVLVCLAMAAAACSGSPSHPGAGSSSGAEGALAYAQCMRAHGLTNFPDPNAQGGFSGTGGADTNSQQYQAAQTACQSKLGGGHLSPARQREMQARLLKFAQCMRTHGVPGYPDPSFGPGGMVSQKIGKSSGVDPRSPLFQAAQKTCMQSAGMGPHGGSGATTGSGS